MVRFEYFDDLRLIEEKEVVLIPVGLRVMTANVPEDGYCLIR